MSSAPAVSRSRRGRRRILAAFVLPLGLLAAAEGLLRAVAGDVLFPPGMEAWERFIDPGDDILQRFRPGARLDFSLLRPDVSIPIRANRLGFRGDDPETAPPDAVRVACLGDSSTFGWFLREEETWPAVLARILEEAGTETAVWNFGLPGYTTFQGALVAERFVAPLRPDVAIAAYGFNDAFEEGETDPVKRARLREKASRRRGFAGGMRRLAERTAIGRTIRLLREGRENRGDGPGGDPDGGGGPGKDRGGSPRRVPPPLQENSLRRLIHALRDAGSQVMVLDLDLANSYGASRRARVAEAEGCPHLDAAAVLARGGTPGEDPAGGPPPSGEVEAYLERLDPPPLLPPRVLAGITGIAADAGTLPGVTITLHGAEGTSLDPAAWIHIRQRDGEEGGPLWSAPVEGHEVASAAPSDAPADAARKKVPGTWRWPRVTLPAAEPLEFTIGARGLAEDPAERSRAGWIPLPRAREDPPPAAGPPGDPRAPSAAPDPRLTLTWPGPLESHLLAGERIHPNAAAASRIARAVAARLRQLGWLLREPNPPGKPR